MMYLCWSQRSFVQLLSQFLGTVQELEMKFCKDRKRETKRLEADRKKFPFILPCKCSKVWSRKSELDLVIQAESCFSLQNGRIGWVKTLPEKWERVLFRFFAALLVLKVASVQTDKAHSSLHSGL